MTSNWEAAILYKCRLREYFGACMREPYLLRACDSISLNLYYTRVLMKSKYFTVESMILEKSVIDFIKVVDSMPIAYPGHVLLEMSFISCDGRETIKTIRKENIPMHLFIYVCIYVYSCIYTYMHTYKIYIHTYIYIHNHTMYTLCYITCRRRGNCVKIIARRQIVNCKETIGGGSQILYKFKRMGNLWCIDWTM